MEILGFIWCCCGGSAGALLFAALFVALMCRKGFKFACWVTFSVFFWTAYAAFLILGSWPLVSKIAAALLPASFVLFAVVSLKKEKNPSEPS